MAVSSLRIAALATLPALLLAGCTTVSPEAKVRAKLIEAGLSPRMSGCMAEKMVDRLSTDQLRQLKSFSSVPRADMRDMTVDRFIHKLRALNDPEIFSVTSRAALSCAIAG
jgi:outer membrane murein-binding lipoprotein Lpp